MPAPETRLARAQRERRLGERAERAGDWRGAILHYRAALAMHRGVGVRRRLAQLEAQETACEDAAPMRPAIPPRTARPGPRPMRAPRPTGSVQLACRINRALHTQVRAQAARAGQTVRTVVIGALERALAGRATRARS